MNPSAISTISKKMESMSMTHRVVRHNMRLPQSRYSPYTLGSVRSVIATIPYTLRMKFSSEMQKDEADRLGVELSLFVAETMFLLSDDIRSMLLFCAQLILKYTGKKDVKNPSEVVTRLIFVILYVFETYIKPKNGVYQDGGKSTQWELINTSIQHFVYGVRTLERIDLVLKNGGLMPLSDFEHCIQELKKLEEKLRSSKDVSEANGFAREAMKSNILHLWKWKSPPPKIINPRIRVVEMFRHLLNQERVDVCSILITSLHV